MTEETNSSPAAAEYFAHIVGVMQENEEFLRKNATSTYEETVALINDAIDNVGLAVGRPEREKDYLERSVVFFIYHVLMPFSYALYLDLLAGNVPACFMELRLMLESLAKCYIADAKYSERAFFQERLELLEQEMEQARVSTSKLMKELGMKLGATSDFVSLWGKLSKDWLHTKGFADKLVGHVIEESNMPSWALVIPTNYTESDMSMVEELHNRISQFRHLLATTMEKYKGDSPDAD